MPVYAQFPQLKCPSCLLPLDKHRSILHVIRMTSNPSQHHPSVLCFLLKEYACTHSRILAFHVSLADEHRAGWTFPRGASHQPVPLPAAFLLFIHLSCSNAPMQMEFFFPFSDTGLRMGATQGHLSQDWHNPKDYAKAECESLRLCRVRSLRGKGFQGVESLWLWWRMN